MAGYDSPKSRGMRKKYEDRNLDKYGQTTTIAGGIKRKKKTKKKIDGRDRSNTSRVGVGTLEPDKNKTEPKSKSILKQPERTTQNPTKKTTPNTTPNTTQKTQAELTREKYLRKSPTTTTTTTKSRANETQEERAARSRRENIAARAAAAEKGAAQRAKVKKFVTGIGSSISGKFKELQAKEKARLEAQKVARLARTEEKRKNQLKVAQEREKKRKEKAEIEANRPETLTEKNIRLQREKSEQNRKRFSTFKKGGLVKKKTATKKTTRKPAARVAKKGIDGVALRGKTRAVRSR